MCVCVERESERVRARARERERESVCVRERERERETEREREAQSLAQGGYLDAHRIALARTRRTPHQRFVRERSGGPEAVKTG